MINTFCWIQDSDMYQFIGGGYRWFAIPDVNLTIDVYPNRCIEHDHLRFFWMRIESNQFYAGSYENQPNWDRVDLFSAPQIDHYNFVEASFPLDSYVIRISQLLWNQNFIIRGFRLLK